MRSMVEGHARLVLAVKGQENPPVPLHQLCWSPSPCRGGPYRANSCPMSAKALISTALPLGSRKNMVACSPTSPLKRR